MYDRSAGACSVNFNMEKPHLQCLSGDEKKKVILITRIMCKHLRQYFVVCSHLRSVCPVLREATLYFLFFSNEML